MYLSSRHIKSKMCFSDEQIQRVCGLLILKETKVFIYCCRVCECEYSTGSDLEKHILLEHVKEVDDDDDVPDQNKTNTKKKAQEKDRQKNKENVCSNKVKPTTKKAVQTPSKPPKPLNSSKPSKSSKPTVTLKEPEPTVFYCDMCPELSFRTYRLMKLHIERHIASKHRKQCPICQKTPLKLAKHLAMHHSVANPYRCDVCKVSFKKPLRYRVHMRKHRSKRIYSCAMCGKPFNSLDAKNKHIKRTHTKQMPHQCTECEKSFISPSDRQDHIFAMHSTARPYFCDICDKPFSRRQNLALHMKTHGDKIFACKFCTKTFKTSSTRTKHEKAVHKPKCMALEIESPFVRPREK